MHVDWMEHNPSLSTMGKLLVAPPVVVAVKD